MKTKIMHLTSAIVLSGFVALALGSGDDDKKSSTKNSGITDTEASSEPDVEILSTNATYESVTNSYTVHCRVKNNTDKLINYVDLQGTFYDKAGTIVGTGMGNAANLAAGAEKTIDVFGLDINNVDHYEVQVNNTL